MNATLLLTRPGILSHGALLNPRRVALEVPLRANADRPESHYGIGVLEMPSGEILDGFLFRFWRDQAGAVIVTDDPPAVARALGVPWQPDWHEAGIVTDLAQWTWPVRDVDAGHRSA